MRGTAQAAVETKNITQTIAGLASLKTLAKAVQAAGLEKILSDNGPYTIFAPNNNAFNKLPEGAMETLMENRENLSTLLKYHVVSGKFMSADLMGESYAKTLQGGSITVDTSQEAVVNNANIVKFDIECSNGVIHIIDSVLIPQ